MNACDGSELLSREYVVGMSERTSGHTGYDRGHARVNRDQFGGVKRDELSRVKLVGAELWRRNGL